ncbi:MAG TPA: hypothetical protein VK557_15555, partial [Pyrinomonadaceae bacterium]|nr:hypothetical protein [Pyrinomonadaceae bacterium]
SVSVKESLEFTQGGEALLHNISTGSGSDRVTNVLILIVSINATRSLPLPVLTSRKTICLLPRLRLIAFAVIN